MTTATKSSKQEKKTMKKVAFKTDFEHQIVQV
jgi:hypothetical protein